MTGPAIPILRTVPSDGAACSGLDDAEAVDFFSTDPVDVAAARNICARCPVQLRCLAGALARDEQWGVWGGWLFEPRIVRARVLPVDVDRADAQKSGDRADGANEEAGQGAGWLLRTTDLWRRHRVRGWFATKGSAVIVADRWERESRWRAEIGFRFAAVLAGLVPDHELHAPGRVPAASPRKARRRRELVTVDGAVDGRLDQLVDLLITRLGRDENRRSPVRVGMAATPSQRQAA